MSFNSFHTRRKALLNNGGVPLADNIISYWNFNGNANDSKGTNNGTATSVTYPSSTIQGQCADFSAGIPSVIDVPGANNLSFGNGTTDSPFSISLWFFKNSGSQNSLVSKASSQREYEIYMFANTVRMRLSSQGNSTVSLNVALNQTISNSTWYNIILTYDGNKGLKGYINNVAHTSINEIGTYVAMSNTTENLYFGKFPTRTDYSLDGRIDELYIFDKELTTQEVDYVYNQGLAGNTLI